MRSLLAVLFLGASTLGACTLPGNHYDPSPDAPPPAPDAPHVDASPDAHLTPTIEVTQLAVTLPEGGTTTIGVSLSGPPGGAFPVTVESDPSVVTAAPGTLVFTDTNYQTPQTVTLHGTADTDTSSAVGTVTLSSPGVAPALVQVTVIDDDVLSIVASKSTLSVTEGGTGTIALHLSAQPPGNVTVTAVTSQGPVSVSPTSVTFTPADYNNDQVLTVTGLEDANTTDEDVVLTLHASAPGVADVSIPVHVADDETLSIVASKSTLALIEGGTGGTIALSLSAQPPGNVTVTAAPGDGKLSLSAPSFTFTPSNYNVPQVLTVSALQDADTVDNTDFVTLSAAGLSPVQVTVNITDDDVQKIVTSAPAQIVIAEGASMTFTVRLAFAPGGTVTIGTTSASGKVTLAPASLVFNDANYATPKTVTVSAVHDPDVINDTDTIILSGAGVPPVSIPVTVIDNTDITIALSTSAMTIDEGTSQTFTVSLTAQPPSSMTVNIVSADPSVASVSPVALTFTPSNYNTPQVVMVTVPHDSNTTDETTLVTAKSATLSSKSIQITAHDTGP